MACVRCAGVMTQPISVRSVKDLELCAACAKTLAALEHEATAPIIVAAFAQFLSDWIATLPTEPCPHEPARQFWTSLEPFDESVDLENTAEALKALIAHAPSKTKAATH